LRKCLKDLLGLNPHFHLKTHGRLLGGSTSINFLVSILVQAIGASCSLPSARYSFETRAPLSFGISSLRSQETHLVCPLLSQCCPAFIQTQHYKDTMENMASYLLKYEGFTPPVDGHDANNQYNVSLHNTTGPVKITTNNYEWPNRVKLMSAAGQVPGFEFNLDPNSGYMLGLSNMQSESNFFALFGWALAYSSDSSSSQPRGASTGPLFSYLI
jgi:hypothetical protein